MYCFMPLSHTENSSVYCALLMRTSVMIRCVSLSGIHTHPFVASVLRQALVNARSLNPRGWHAGTPLGDPIEVGALRQALAATGGAAPLALLSSKSCFGHTEGAAGAPSHTVRVYQRQS